MDQSRDPYAYDESAAARLLHAVASGLTLREICLAGMGPALSVVGAWLLDNPEFEARYRRARAVAMEMTADDLMAWANAGPARDYRELGRRPTLGEITAAHRTRIAVKQWLMAKWAPDTFGGRAITDNEHAGESQEADAPPMAAPSPGAPPAQPRLVARPFTIAPIPAVEPIAPAALPRPARAPAAVANDGPAPEAADADEPDAPSRRPSRHQRRAMASMAHRRPPVLAAHSRAPPG
jgi:hypothetical protein